MITYDDIIIKVIIDYVTCYQILTTPCSTPCMENDKVGVHKIIFWQCVDQRPVEIFRSRVGSFCSSLTLMELTLILQWQVSF